MKPGMDAVIPAFNEAETVAEVVRAVKAAPCIRRVIVVDDGSQDGTAQQAQEAGAVVLIHAENQGKTAAMKTGVEAVDGELVLFLDADLIGLTPELVSDLCRPVLSGQAITSLGIFKSGRGVTDAAQKLTPFLSGQRVIPVALFNQAMARHQCSGFGVEMAITRLLKEENIVSYKVEMTNMSHRTKEEKRGFMKGSYARVIMYRDLLIKKKIKKKKMKPVKRKGKVKSKTKKKTV